VKLINRFLEKYYNGWGFEGICVSVSVSARI
jgi:hypothetical protein